MNELTREDVLDAVKGARNGVFLYLGIYLVYFWYARVVGGLPLWPSVIVDILVILCLVCSVYLISNLKLLGPVLALIGMFLPILAFLLFTIIPYTVVAGLIVVFVELRAVIVLNRYVQIRDSGF